MTVVWLNGRTVEAPGLDPSDRGFLLADGAFATLLVRHGRPVFLFAHLERLREALDALSIDVRIDDATLATAIRHTARATGHDRGDAIARITVTRGTGARGFDPTAHRYTPTLLVTMHPVPPPTPPRTAVVVSIRRNEGSPTSRLKTLSYTDNLLAVLEAKRAGAEEAIMLNHHGRVACAAAANLILVTGKQVSTPPPAEGVRPGVARAVVLNEALRMGCTVRERPMKPAELERGVLLATNAARGPYRLLVDRGSAGVEDERTADSLREGFWRRVDEV